MVFQVFYVVDANEVPVLLEESNFLPCLSMPDPMNQIHGELFATLRPSQIKDVRVEPSSSTYNSNDAVHAVDEYGEEGDED